MYISMDNIFKNWYNNNEQANISMGRKEKFREF
jgi:hypothetical protein